MPLGVGVEQVAGLGDRGLVPDRGHHVLQRPPPGRVIVDVVGRQQGEAVGSRQHVEPVDPGAVVAGVKMARGEMAQGWELLGEAREDVGERRGQ